LIKVPAKNTSPLSELNDFDEILDEGKRLAEHDQNYDKAVLYFKKAIKLEPENARVYYNIAETLYNHLDKKDSVEYYKKLLELIPTHTTAKNRLKSMNVPLTDETEMSDTLKEAERLNKKLHEQIKAEFKALEEDKRIESELQHKKLHEQIKAEFKALEEDKRIEAKRILESHSMILEQS